MAETTGRRNVAGAVTRAILVAGLIVMLGIVGGCDSLHLVSGDDNGNSNGSGSADTPGALEITQGLFENIVVPVVSLQGYRVEAATRTSHSWDLLYDGYTPPLETFLVSGTVAVDVTSENPLTVTIGTAGDLSLTGFGDIDQIGISDCVVAWATGDDLDNEPSSVSGEFTVTRTGVPEAEVYDMENILAAQEGDQPDNGENGIPEDVVEIAGGILQSAGNALRFYYQGPSLGFNIETSTTATGWHADVLLEDFSPGDDGGLAEGGLGISIPSLDPFTVDVETTEQIVLRMNDERITIALTARAVWAAEEHPMSSPPETLDGTITVDGTDYEIAELLAEQEAGRLPDTFRTTGGDFLQEFRDQVWRPATGNPGEPWARYNYMRFVINATGDRHQYFHHAGGDGSDGEYVYQGAIDWQIDGNGSADPVVDFLNDDGGWAVGFTVLDYSASHLHLQTPWGSDGPREWIFSSGRDNMTGVVVDRGSMQTRQHYSYYTPIPGETVELRLDKPGGLSTPIATTTTDARGFFEFGALSGLDTGVYEYPARITIAGFQEEEGHEVNRNHPLDPEKATFTFVMVYQ